MSLAILPSFSLPDPQEFIGNLDKLISANLLQLDLITKNNLFTWENIILPLEDMEDEFERFWAPFEHLHAVVDSEILRGCYETCLPKITIYEAKIAQNQDLYEAIKSIDTQSLNSVQKKIIADMLRDFKLSGALLSTNNKQCFETIQVKLAQLTNQFENNILDAEAAFNLHVTEKSRLNGLPKHTLEAAATLALERGLEGWLFNLEYPCYFAVINYASDRSLREQMYYAYITRASELGPNAKEFDNTALIEEILKLRHEKAILLGFSNYAELSVLPKMAEVPSRVNDFLENLITSIYPVANKEYEDLESFAGLTQGLTEIKPWDIAYLIEKDKQIRFAFSDEDLRPYFSEPKVMQGMFAIINKLYGMKASKIEGVSTWHTDVVCYSIIDEEDKIRGYIYMDLFARPHKRAGAWMNSCQSRRKMSAKKMQLPIATLTCNFAKAHKNQMASFSHEEVVTLFHEFGHCLHHVLTKVDEYSAAGLNGVAWDFVELPSQFFENWCWENEGLNLLSEHIDTGESFPKELLDKVVAAKNFNKALSMLRQLELASFDFSLHQDSTLEKNGLVMRTLAKVRKKTSISPIAEYNRFPNNFAHIFAGGYAAGYYSYLWAEVLSSDAFARFKEEGIFNYKTGRDFLHFILEAGGSKKSADIYLDFRGHEPTITAFLEQNGMPHA